MNNNKSPAWSLVAPSRSDPSDLRHNWGFFPFVFYHSPVAAYKNSKFKTEFSRENPTVSLAGRSSQRNIKKILAWRSCRENCISIMLYKQPLEVMHFDILPAKKNESGRRWKPEHLN